MWADLSFHTRVLLEVTILAGLSAFIGTHVLDRKLSFLTHALGHATFPSPACGQPGVKPPGSGTLAPARTRNADGRGMPSRFQGIRIATLHQFAQQQRELVVRRSLDGSGIRN